MAAGLVAVEGLFLVGYAVLELFHLSADRVALALTTTAFFAAFGAGLLVCCTGRWPGCGPGPAARCVVAQLIQLLVAWSFRGGEHHAASRSCSALVAVVVLVASCIRPARGALARRTRLAQDADGSSRDVRSCSRVLVQQPRHVHLGDPDLLGDLRLGHVLEEPSSRICFSRASSRSSSGLSDSRISTCSRLSSATPIASSIVPEPVSESVLASSDSVE